MLCEGTINGFKYSHSNESIIISAIINTATTTTTNNNKLSILVVLPNYDT